MCLEHGCVYGVADSAEILRIIAVDVSTQQ